MVKIALDVSDEWLPDPVDPPLLRLREDLLNGKVGNGRLFDLDKTTKAHRTQQDKTQAVAFFPFFVLLPCLLYLSGRMK